MPLEITWVGHASVLIELDGSRLLTDPVLGMRVGALVRIAAPVAPESADGIDIVLVSHLHADHADAASLQRAGASATVVGPSGSGVWLRRRGLIDVQELRPGDRLVAGPLRVQAVLAVHDGRRHPLAVPSDSIGFVVRGTSSFYFAGDTDLFPQMAEIAGDHLDLALLPVSGWGPTLGPGHLDPERAARAAALVAPRVAIPIHWGTLALPLGIARPADAQRPAREFKRHAEQIAPDVEVRVLSPGERTTVD